MRDGHRGPSRSGDRRPGRHGRPHRAPLGPALGTGGPPFGAVELTLAEGSVLALHTDGLTGADTTRPGDIEARLGAAVAQAGESLDDRCRAVVDALAPARPRDDVVLPMARTGRLDTGRVASWDLPSDPAAVAEMTKPAIRQLTAWGLDELSFATEPVVSELVTNAIRHATGPVRLRLIVDNVLICEVFDASATAPHLRRSKTTDEGGRGLFLMSRFTRRWGTRHIRDGKVIWAEQSLTEPAGSFTESAGSLTESAG
ncbi:SpoIIE family protein phosphatase [Streptomyces spiralis]